MGAAGWLSRWAAEVPQGDDWLGPRERAVQGGLRAPRRLADWRLGRWTAKQALAAWGARGAAQDLEILAAPDGAPEVWVRERRLALSLSLSHRAGRSLVVVAEAAPGPIGCDLERIEPRSAAFVRDWLVPAEQAYVAAQETPEGRALAANLCWSAKEAASKVRREGLRLDVRQAVVSVGAAAPTPGDWGALRVDWTGAAPVTGWWRHDGGFVAVVVGTPDPPVDLAQS
jgi:4'-phosphopantetheinyl transferase